MILAGDIGGTSTRLAVFDIAEGRLRQVSAEQYRSREHAGLEGIVRIFRAAHPGPIALACFGVAGHVADGRAETLNLPWVIDAAGLARETGLARVRLINDLEANAHGIAALEPADLVVLNAGAPSGRGNAAVISAGTGLGEAGIYWDGARHHPFACEGGHADFAPRTDIEIELLRYLQGKLEGRVSCERVVSGPGLASIYAFLRDTGRGSEPDWLRDAIRGGDPPAVISTAAVENRSELCVQALDLFVSAYGAEAGNLALKILATGGLYVGGGIAPKILDRLKQPGFLEAFVAKGRLARLLERIPVRVITNERTALYGAARCAALGASLIEPAAL